MTDALVSPLARPVTTGIAAPRGAPGRATRALLIDGMLNRQAGWGDGLLDGVEALLRSTGVRAFARTQRNSTTTLPPEEWAGTMATGADLAVAVVGD